MGPYQASYPGPARLRHSGPVTSLAQLDGDRWLAMRQAEIVEHKWKPPAPAAKAVTPTLTEYSANWLVTRRTRSGEPPKSRTLDLCGVLLGKQILPVLGPMRIGEISADDVDEWYARLAALRANPPSADVLPSDRDHAYRRDRPTPADR